MKTSVEKAELYTRTSLIEPNIHDLWNITDSSFHVYSFFCFFISSLSHSMNGTTKNFLYVLSLSVCVTKRIEENRMPLFVLC